MSIPVGGGGNVGITFDKGREEVATPLPPRGGGRGSSLPPTEGRKVSDAFVVELGTELGRGTGKGATLPLPPEFVVTPLPVDFHFAPTGIF